MRWWAKTHFLNSCHSPAPQRFICDPIQPRPPPLAISHVRSRVLGSRHHATMTWRGEGARSTIMTGLSSCDTCGRWLSQTSMEERTTRGTPVNKCNALMLRVKCVGCDVTVSWTGFSFRLAPTRSPKGFSTLNIEDQTVLYALQQRTLNGPLNLEDAAGFSIYRVSLNDPLFIWLL
jgi:hypothetical protein